MKAEHSVEEVWERFEAWLIREHEYAPEDLIWQEKRNCYADYATNLAWNAYRDAYAERIKADEGAVPTFSRSDVSKWRDDAFENAAQIVDRYAKHFPEVTGAADGIRALIAHPPAQAAQVDAFADRLRQSIMRDTFQPTAEPVAKAWLCDNGHSENLMVTLSPRVRDACAALGGTITPLYTHPAPPINLVAVREVIASHINEAKKLRHDPETQDYLYAQADKLETAIRGEG